MTKDEAMKLALEALRQIDEAMPFPVAKLAQAALREALAEQPAQQEPVAAQSVMTVRIWRDKNSDQNAEFKNWHKLPDGEHILYTSPPAQRTWVGLTPEELDEMFSKTLKGKKLVNWVARVIETKLKEKNT